MRELSRLTILFATLGLGCAASPTVPSDSGDNTPMPLATCIVGWFHDAATSACDLGCRASTPPPECEAADCIQRCYVGFGSDGSEVEGCYMFSASVGTFSSMAATTERTYATTETTLTRSPPGTARDASCTATALTLDGWSVQPRAGAGLARALEMLVPESTWRGAPLTSE